MVDCDHNCEGCSVENCGSRKIEKLKPNELSNIKHCYAIMSGKGGVGKSLVTSLIASELSKRGKSVAIIDADVTGPSIPQAFGLKGKFAPSDETHIYPVLSKSGIKIISANLLLQDEEAPIVWRGPIVSGFVQQLFTDVVYGDVDYMFIDMPPGTSDIPLTIFQMLPIDGVIVVTSPQELVSMVVIKSINMAKMLMIPMVGVVENMAYVKCPHCDEKIRIYGDEHSKENIEKNGVEVLAELAIDPKLSSLVDKGLIEDYRCDSLDKLIEKISSK